MGSNIKLNDMERIREIIDKYGSFAWWCLMALLMLSAFIGCCIGIKDAVAINVCGMVGSILAMLIFGWQAYGEWLEIE